MPFAAHIVAQFLCSFLNLHTKHIIKAKHGCWLDTHLGHTLFRSPEFSTKMRVILRFANSLAHVLRPIKKGMPQVVCCSSKTRSASGRLSLSGDGCYQGAWCVLGTGVIWGLAVSWGWVLSGGIAVSWGWVLSRGRLPWHPLLLAHSKKC